jgi:SlyX protein
MTSSTEIAERLDAVEAHLAHQDVTIQELSDVALKQWRTIEDLSHKLERLEAQLQAVEDAVNRPAGEDPPPPHY